MLTKIEAVALANLLHRLRPNWRPDQTLRYLQERCEDTDLPEIVLPAIIAALNPAIRSPRIIFEDGNHWTQARIIKPAAYQPAKPPMCEDHPTYEARNCSCCWADVKTGDRPHTHIGKHNPPPTIPNPSHPPQPLQPLQLKTTNPDNPTTIAWWPTQAA